MNQKDAVVKEVTSLLPNFVKGHDVALELLSPSELEQVKSNVVSGILNGTIDYGKDAGNVKEVTAYGRSMVINHLKKASALNGGKAQVVVTPRSNAIKASLNVPSDGIDRSVLTEDLAEFISTI
jgi:hypothetical protein